MRQSPGRLHIFIDSKALLWAAVLCPWLLWTTPAPRTAADDRTPPESSTVSLPGGGFVFVRDGELYRADGAGEASEQLTFSGGRVSWPELLPDGRLLIRLHTGDGSGERLMTIHPDGTWMTPWLGDSPVPAPEATPVLPSIVKPDRKTGYLLIFDVARSGDLELSREEIAALRVLLRENGGTDRVLAEVEPEPDGSVFLELPADRSLGLELVGHDGRGLARMKTPFWVRPNERRACLGCHVAPYYAPPNVRPQALGREARQVGLKTEGEP